MSVLFVLIGISLAVATGFLAAFIWAVKKGQYEDSYTPSVRILFENELPDQQSTTNKNQITDKN